jgi:hypothetical protein
VEIITVTIYATVTIAISIANARYFNTDETTKTLSIIMNCVYCAAKIVFMVVNVAIKGLIYNKVYCDSNNVRTCGFGDSGHLCPVVFNYC